MEFVLTAEDVSEQLRHNFEEMFVRSGVVQQIVGAMGAEFKMMCVENLGETGTTRPDTWPALSEDYAKKVKRDYATLYVTGNLHRSIKMNVFSDYARVYVDPSDCWYAEYHQFGVGKMPPRPFFPINGDGDITPMAFERVHNAAERMLEATLTGTNYIGPIYGSEPSTVSVAQSNPISGYTLPVHAFAKRLKSKKRHMTLEERGIAAANKKYK